MTNNVGSHNETVIAFFEQNIVWWPEVYRADLPMGFFSFEMRNRLSLVVDELSMQIQRMDDPDVLECGCGTGDILEQLAPLRCKLSGIDINPRYREIAAKRIPRAVILDGDIERLPFPDQSFDIVFAVGVLLYVNNDHRAIAEMARVTKPGGFLLISVPNFLMLHLLLDPYYIYKYLKKIFRRRASTPAAFDENKIRRYFFGQLIKACATQQLHAVRTLTTSFGPGRFWCKELLPLAVSIGISEILRGLSRTRIFSPLHRVGNHWILALRKGPT